jgi:predicted transcriptional regulator
MKKVAVHTDRDPKEVFAELKTMKRLAHVTFKERDRKPGM